MLLIGQGPYPAPATQRMGFSQLRLRHFDQALRQAGHEVRTAVIDGEAGMAAGWEGRFGCGEAELGGLVEGAEVVVTAGPYAPGRAGVRIAQDRPLWVDVPGDPFAELQAQAVLGPVPTARVAAALAAALPVLTRADAISTVSERQRHAALGQLAATGRLVDPQLQERVCTIPIAFDFPVGRGAARARGPGDPLVLALTGGFNAWFDAETLVAGLDRAFQQEPALRLVATGGPLPHHPREGYDALAAWSATVGDRVRLGGWVPHSELVETLREAHVGLSLDRPGLEPALGSRTRVLLFAWLGIEVLATPATELLSEMVAHGLATGVPAGDPAALADALLRLVRQPTGGGSDRAAVWLAERFAPQGVAAPLLSWVARPQRAPTIVDPTALLGSENTRLNAELTAIYDTPTWKALSAAHRWLARLRWSR